MTKVLILVLMGNTSEVVVGTRKVLVESVGISTCVVVDVATVEEELWEGGTKTRSVKLGSECCVALPICKSWI